MLNSPSLGGSLSSYSNSESGFSIFSLPSREPTPPNIRQHLPDAPDRIIFSPRLGAHLTGHDPEQEEHQWGNITHREPSIESDSTIVLPLPPSVIDPGLHETKQNTRTADWVLRVPSPRSHTGMPSVDESFINMPETESFSNRSGSSTPEILWANKFEVVSRATTPNELFPPMYTADHECDESAQLPGTGEMSDSAAAQLFMNFYKTVQSTATGAQLLMNLYKADQSTATGRTVDSHLLDRNPYSHNNHQYTPSIRSTAL